MMVYGALTGSDAALPDAQTLRARMSAASGSPNGNYRETIVASGAGGSTLTTRVHRGADELVRFTRGPVRTSYGTYRGSDWHQTANGLVVPDGHDAGVAPTQKSTPVVQRTWSPVPAYAISELDASGYGRRDVVAPGSYLVLRHDVIGPAGTVTTTYANYARFGTETLPSSWRVADGSVGETTSYARTQFAAGSTRPADVAEPALRQLVSLPSGATAVDVHARFEGGRILIPVAIAGRRFYFLLDSGASAITIDPRVAKQLGLPLANASHDIAGDRFERHETIVPAMEVSGLRMHDVAVSVVALQMGSKPSDPAGLLGFDFLAGLALRIDYEHRRVIAMDVRSYVPPAGKDVSALEIRLGSQVPMIKAKLGGALAERLIVDTGSGGSLLLFGYFARRHGDVLRYRLDDLAGPDATADVSAGIGGAFASRPYRLPDVRIGRFSISDLVADVVTSSSAYPQDDDGLIGSDMLQFFTIDLDYAAGRIFLRARPQLKKFVS